MENNLRNFRKALCEAMKEDIKNLSKEQKTLKQQRKLAYRPADKQLWEIQYQIIENAGKINELIRFYRWAKHSIEYWAKRDVNNYYEFLFYLSTSSNKDDREMTWHFVKYKDQDVKSYIPLWVWRMYSGMNSYIEYCKKYNIEFTIPLIQQILLNVR